MLMLLIIPLLFISCSDSGTGNIPEEPSQHVSQILFSLDNAFIGMGDTLTPEVTVLNKNGQVMAGQSVVWSSVDPSVAGVTSGGMITGKSPGTTTIQVMVKDISESIQVEVFRGNGYSSYQLADIDRAVVNYMAQHNIPGISVAVVKDGQLVHTRGYGYADPEDQSLVEPSAIFRYGSVSKPITSLATMMLLEEGLLHLDDKPFEILDHLPVIGGKSEDPRLADITLEQLLTHSGGWNSNRNVDNEVWRAVSQLGVRNDAEMFRYGRSVNLAANPGIEYSYTNYATQVVGLLIEHITGTDYEEWVQANLFEPAGVTNVKFGKAALGDREPNEVRYHRANGYRPDIDDGSMDYYGASGSWIGRAVDLMRLLNAIEGKAGLGPILTTKTIELMTERPDFYSPGGSYYAKFWGIIPASDGLNWHHAGLADGAFADIWRMSNGVSYAILMNQSPPGPRPDLRSVLNGISEWPEDDFFAEFY
jgi:CubicO group peptidase (beta-lactamase class C family)